MKKILPLLFLCSTLLVGRAKAQFIIAGIPGTFYTDIVPDTLLTCPPNYYVTSQRLFDLDVNNDGQDDLEMRVNYTIHTSFINKFIDVTCLDTSTYLAFGRIDSLYHSWMGYWSFEKIIRPFQYNDTINLSGTQWYNSVMFLTDSSYSSGAGRNVRDWIAPQDQFIGVKYSNGSALMYGWIRVNCTAIHQCYIKDYSFYSMPVAINEMNPNSYSVFPNPVSGNLHISADETEGIWKIELIDHLGNIVGIARKNGNINTSELPEGIYFLIIRLDKKTITEKIIIQH